MLGSRSKIVVNVKVRIVLAAAIVAALSVSVAPQSISTVSEIPTVAFCDVIKNPQRYDGKLIRLHVVWLGNFEWEWLYATGSDGCESHKNFIRPFLDCPGDEVCKPLQNTLNANLRGDPLDGMKATFIVTGHFHYRKGPLDAQNGEWYYKLGVTHISALKHSRRGKRPSRKR